MTAPLDPQAFPRLLEMPWDPQQDDAREAGAGARSRAPGGVWLALLWGPLTPGAILCLGGCHPRSETGLPGSRSTADPPPRRLVTPDPCRSEIAPGPPGPHVQGVQPARLQAAVGRAGLSQALKSGGRAALSPRGTVNKAPDEG